MWAVPVKLKSLQLHPLMQRIPLHIALLLTLLTAICVAGHASATPPASEQAPIRHVILITLDGMRPDFYLSRSLGPHAPFLREMSRKGAYAQGAVVAYPSTTYPSHANISTGVRPHRHGVVSSTQFRPPKLDGRGYWYQGDLKAPSIWQRAYAAGLTIAALSWPSSATAPEMEWNFPEFWGSRRGSEIRQVFRRATTNVLDLADEVFNDEWPAMLGPAHQRDAFLARMAQEIILRHKPNLLLLHFLETDTVQHRAGTSAPQVRTALRRTDRHLRDIYNTVQKAGLGDHTVFIIAGDHGFTDVSYMFAPNVLLMEHGYLERQDGEITAWEALADGTSGSAAIYLRDPGDAETREAIKQLFRDHALDDAGRTIYRIISREELDLLGATPKAAFYLEGIPPYMASGAYTGHFVRNATLRGNHGYLPTNKEMLTGFVAFGPGIRPARLDQIELIDIAPTIAALMGFDMPDVEGRVLTEILP